MQNLSYQTIYEFPYVNPGRIKNENNVGDLTILIE
jgi:hypothetical protein